MELGFSNNLQNTAIGYSSNDKNELAFIENSQWTYGTYTLGVTAPILQYTCSMVRRERHP